jgi:hypothetical protein
MSSILSLYGIVADGSCLQYPRTGTLLLVRSTSHMRMRPSLRFRSMCAVISRLPPLAPSPRGVNRHRFTAPLAAQSSVSSSCPVATSHVRIMPSPEIVASRRPSGVMAIAGMCCECPSSVCRHPPVATSHTRALPSVHAVHSTLSSGVKHTAVTRPAWPCRSVRHRGGFSTDSAVGFSD